MNYEELQAYMAGKVFLIGLTFLDPADEVIEKYQTHGTVEALTDAQVFEFRLQDGSLFRLPFDPETIIQAPPADYREHSTGQVIHHPDFITTWEIQVGPGLSTDLIKQQGFVIT
ncbi:MAG: hypothetical protein SF053_14515 [Bacteroidia bacterium]|nr:hypothetical protein [Bacteroidia bacterium]